MQPLKKFSLESIRAIARNPILIYNQSAYILNQTSNITFENNNFKNYLQKWIQYNDNPKIKTYANLQKQQAFQTYTHKSIAGLLKI